LKPEGCPNGLGEHSALLAQAGVFSGFTENTDTCRLFLKAEGLKAEVFILPLVFIGGILPPGGSSFWRSKNAVSLSLRFGLRSRGFPAGSREVPLPNRPLLWTCAVNERGGARALERAPEASEAWRAKRSERAVNGGQGRPT